jgi:hypothetical protein
MKPLAIVRCKTDMQDVHFVKVYLYDLPLIKVYISYFIFSLTHRISYLMVCIIHSLACPFLIGFSCIMSCKNALFLKASSPT